MIAFSVIAELYQTHQKQKPTMKKQSQKQPAVHIGQLIRERLTEIGMTKSEFARRLGTSPQNVFGIFKRPSGDSELLAKISVVLNYNLFEHYQAMIPNSDTNKALREAEERVRLLMLDIESISRERDLLKELVEQYRRVVSSHKS